jgi:hypothetical protein
MEFRSRQPASASSATACGAFSSSTISCTRRCSENEFGGRWLRYDDFVFPERRDDILRMKRIKDFYKYQGRS